MSDNSLKYRKRNWHKVKAKVYSVKEVNDKAVELVLYKKDKLYSFVCFGQIRYDALKLNVNFDLNAWFTVSSKLYNGKWYTSLYLMHFESVKDNTIKKDKQVEIQRVSNNLFNGSNWESREDF